MSSLQIIYVDVMPDKTIKVWRDEIEKRINEMKEFDAMMNDREMDGETERELIKIRNGSKRISFTIEKYQYPSEKSNGDDYNYDANWLDVAIEYADETGIKQYRDACLLTYELERCVENIRKIISGEEMLYISDFMEPYLKLAVSQAGDAFVFGIEFVYDMADEIWKSHKVSEVVSQARAQEILDEMKSLNDFFPER